MKFIDALKLMNEGNVITRNGKTFIKKESCYRFTFADRLSDKWYVDNFEGYRVFYTQQSIKGVKYGCLNCRKCQNETQCPNNGYCYLYDREKAPHPRMMPKMEVEE